MESDLEGIAARVQSMAEASRTLMGISTGDQDSFFLRLEGHFTGILKMLGTCSAAQAEMELTAAGLAETIGGMRESVAEIRRIEIRIQRIATNATIRATHIGAAGDALNVIAEAMQGLAHDSNANTEAVASALDAMDDAARGVSGGRGQAETRVESGTGEVTGEMSRAVTELHSSSESSFSRVSQIAALGERLAGDAATVRGGFASGPLFAQVVSRARGELERVITRDGGPSGADAGAAHQMDSLAKNYTMQRERDVHESMTRGSAPPARPAEVARVVPENGGLGDNVELF
jgi:hypothetical protein